jgi:CheY-like chemotaxis protein
MSDAARTILVVTDDSYFSSQLSEFLLRGGIRTVCFARTPEALERACDLLPDQILLHIPREHLDAGWACSALLQAHPKLASIPVLLYTPPCGVTRCAAGSPAGGLIGEHLTASDLLTAQMSSLFGGTRPVQPHVAMAPLQQAFPHGRDDL